MNRRDNRVAEAVAHEAAQFIARETGGESLITVTRALPIVRGEHITVFISVFPDEKAHTALAFLKNRRADFSLYLKTHLRLSPLPRVDFAIDSGETY